MKKYNILKVILISILVVTICTWIFPTQQFNQTLVKGDKMELGLYPLISYIVDLFRYFPYVVLVVLSIGAFYGVMYRIPAYRLTLDKIVDGFKGKENIFLTVIIAIIAILVSVSGLSYGMLFVFPLVISLVLLMGYNKLVAASVTVGSVMVGLIGTTLGSNSVLYINYILQTELFDIMAWKVVILLLALIIYVYNILKYANKTKNSTDMVVDYVPSSLAKTDKKVVVKEEVEVKKEVKKPKKAPVTKKKVASKKTTKTRANDNKTESVKVVKNTKKPNIWPLVVLFDITLLVICMGSFDWTTVFKTEWPADTLKSINEFKIGGFEVLNKLLFGNVVNAFGSWSLNYEIPITIFLASGIIAFIYGLKFDKYIEGVLDGIKKASKPAFYMLLTYLVLIIVVYHPFQLNITKAIVDITKGFNVMTMSLSAMVSSLLNVESAYTAQASLPYITTVITNSSDYQLIGLIYQAIYGLTMLVAPTSVILLGTLSYLDISYTQWLKHIWKVFVELLVVLLAIFIIISLV